MFNKINIYILYFSQNKNIILKYSFNSKLK